MLPQDRDGMPDIRVQVRQSCGNLPYPGLIYPPGFP